MSDKTVDANEAFIEVALSKIEKQDKRMGKIEDLVATLTENNSEVKQLLQGIETLKSDIRSTSVPEGKIAALSVQIELLTRKLAAPPSSKVLHHHHVPKVIWATTLLIVVVCIVSAGWFYTGRKLNGFIENDTKYRALRLDTASKNLQDYLDRLDSVYDANPDMREQILQTENQYRANFYRLQRAIRLKEEARDLEKAAGRK